MARPLSGDQAQIQDAAKKAYQAIADSKIDDLWVLVQSKYDRKLRPEELRPGATGPKVSVAFDGNVKVLRVGKKDAVVGANFFKPDSSDIPASEVSRLDLYMVNDHGSWKIGAPDKKEAAFDGDKGGWYHSGSFTFCPNKKGWCFCPIISAARRSATRPQFAGGSARPSWYGIGRQNRFRRHG